MSAAKTNGNAASTAPAVDLVAALVTLAIGVGNGSVTLSDDERIAARRAATMLLKSLG